MLRPDRQDEAVVNELAAKTSHLVVGQQLEIGLWDRSWGLPCRSPVVWWQPHWCLWRSRR